MRWICDTRLIPPACGPIYDAETGRRGADDADDVAWEAVLDGGTQLR
jgi:hypothetical protein